MNSTANGTWQSTEPGWYTINEMTVIGIQNNIAGLRGTVYQLEERLLATVISACLFGTLALCSCIAVFLNSRRIRATRHAVWYTLAVITMFVATSAYWAIRLRNTFTVAGIATSASTDMERARETQFHLQDCAEEMSQATCAVEPASPLGWLGDPNFTYEYCAGTVALTTNVSIGDAIVWSRVCVLWPGNRAVRLVFVLLLLATISMSVVSTVHSCQGLVAQSELLTPLDYQGHEIAGIGSNIGPSAGNIVGGLFEGDSFGSAASVLSLTTNVISTSLVGYQAWKHRALVRDDGLQSFLGRSRVSRAFMLLIESGACYSVIWSFVVIYQLISAPLYSHSTDYSRPSPSQALGALTAGAESFTEGGLVIVVALYPTIIMLLVALNRSECDTIASHRAEEQLDGAVPSIIFRGSTLQPHDFAQVDSGYPAEGSRTPTSVTVSESSSQDHYVECHS